MPKKELNNRLDDVFDPAERAARGLHNAIEDVADNEDAEVVILDAKLRKKREEIAKKAAIHEEEVLQQAEEKPPEVTVEEALQEQPVLTHVSDRQSARVLIFTKDDSVIADESMSQKRVLELSQIFEEVHVIVLSVNAERNEERIRVSKNAWIYCTHSNAWWRTPFDAVRMAREQLEFAKGFRADLVVAEDPFESGMAGYRIARKYERVLQVHVTDDYFDAGFADLAEFNDIRVWMAKFVLGRADCVRTRSEYLQSRIVDAYPDLEPYTEVLPMYHNLAVWRDTEPKFDVHERYPQFKFILLHVTAMLEGSQTDKVLLGAARILNQYPTVGLVVVGDGPERNTVKHRIKEYGLEGKVIIEPQVDDLLSYMKTANLLLHFSGVEEGDTTVLQAAAAGIPMVVGEAGIADELFVDGESAFICPEDSPVCMGEKISEFLNANQLRARFAMNAQDIVFERVEQRYDVYMKAYKESIERCLAYGSYTDSGATENADATDTPTV